MLHNTSEYKTVGEGKLSKASQDRNEIRWSLKPGIQVSFFMHPYKTVLGTSR